MLLQQDLLAPRVAQAVQLQGGKHDTETEIILRPFLAPVLFVFQR